MPFDEEERYPQTDVYEYHWSHHLTGNRLTDVLWFLRRFLFRSPFGGVAFAWFLAWALVVASAYGTWQFVTWLQDEGERGVSLAAAIVPVALLIGRLLTKDIADVARYLNLSPQDLELFKGQQHDLWREMRRLGNPWLVSDFVTLGSPMKFAHALVAKPEVCQSQRNHGDLGTPGGRGRWEMADW